ncbi:MAG: xanthine dehydrogenase molybdopterin binding subunit [Betaproteobacteria bacterium]|nr:xanthine dehydrogenase molybdopterin binding subunit [Betaproteobacteria bacterium]
MNQPRLESTADTDTVSGKPVRHESAALHVTGQAHYTDDIPLPVDALHIALGQSRVAHGRIRSLDLSAVRAAPGVVAVFTAADVPGENNYGGVLKDDPIFAHDEVQHVGQPIFAVAARSCREARCAALLAVVDYEELPAILDIREAVAKQSFVLPTRVMERGDAPAALAAAPHKLEGSFSMGGQDHFYLEGQVAVALPQDDGALVIHSSTQHPTEVQHIVAHALGIHSHAVSIQCRRMGGGFGGKESQPALFAAIAAIVARKLGCAAKLRLDRDVDMTMTGKRHDFEVDYTVGFDASGRIQALDLMLASRCGYSADLSGPVNDRAMFHVDNCYYLENVRIISHRCKTHTVSNTAFRGFGGPQGMLAIETVIDAIARRLKLDPLQMRRRNFYGKSERNVTHYQMTVEDNIIADLVDQLERSSDYQARRDAIARANALSPVIKRGIALTPVKFGISFTATHFNQAGALVHVYSDGSVLLNHGGLEMGQGLHTKVAQVVADEFGLPLAAIKVSTTDTAKVPNTSATAASSGSDLNGKAAQAAARIIRERMENFLIAKYAVDKTAVKFSGGQVRLGDQAISFAEAARQSWFARVSLSSTGFYATPKIHYDPKTMLGRPFFYFAYGAAVSEVAIDTLTGEHKQLRVDILHDAGCSLNPAIDMGQVEGGFLQGAGWLTSEELWWDGKGQLKTHAPSTYKIPAASDWPAIANIQLLERADNREDSIFRSKAVGEPPLMLAISVFHALRDAVAAAAGDDAALRLMAPATPEAVLKAIGGLGGLDAVVRP